MKVHIHKVNFGKLSFQCIKRGRKVGSKDVLNKYSVSYIRISTLIDLCLIWMIILNFTCGMLFVYHLAYHLLYNTHWQYVSAFVLDDKVHFFYLMYLSLSVFTLHLWVPKWYTVALLVWLWGYIRLHAVQWSCAAKNLQVKNTLSSMIIVPLSIIPLSNKASCNFGTVFIWVNEGFLTYPYISFSL